ncbi:ribosome maturation factor RimM [Radiobacillus kanasensis]|uniref:ribosome maturation factor RimM n=1 Tax=Radiobacillus kanasensis TaxID=2844358 RepID=UPI001E37C495|nr:ribosome maturation factor RimM [Radiobacillus kanasensis]UFU01004.1 ribosome maturation factor RimM [Radiobacillus kanasensis]
MTNHLYNVGKIVNTHGIRGEVKVVRITDFEERFEKGETLYWVSSEGGEPIPLTIDGHRIHKQFDLLHFKSYDSINDVERFKNGMLKIEESQLTPLEEGEYYYHQIIGCEVETVEGEFLGKIKEILSPGANDVWVIQRPKQKDLLIPYIEEIVVDINVEEKKVKIDPMEGLLDE